MWGLQRDYERRRLFDPSRVHEYTIGDLRFFASFKRGHGDAGDFVDRLGGGAWSVIRRKWDLSYEWREIFENAPQEDIDWYCERYRVSRVELMTRKEIIDEVAYRALSD